MVERRRLIAACVAVLLAGIGAAVLGTYSTYTQARTKTQNVATGVFAFDLSDPSGAPFSTDISGLAPGDFADRLVDLNNTGGISYQNVALAAAASPSSALDSDPTNGLQLTIDRCSAAWTQASASVAATCSGSLTTLTAATSVSAFKASGATYTSGLSVLTGGSSAVDHVRFHYALPTSASTTSGLSSTLTYTFTATQATGGAYH